MANIKKLHKKYAFWLILIAVTLFGGILLKGNFFSNSQRFRLICDSVFANELASDSLSLHFSLANPKDYGFEKSLPVFRSYLREERLKQNLMLENAIEQLADINRNKLNPDEKLTYDIITASLEGSLEGEQYIYFSEPFSPTGGIQSEYPLLLAEYAFRSEEDVKNYLEILKQTPSYFNSFLEFEKERIQAGYCLSDENADQVIATCDEFAASCSLLIQTFDDKLKKLISQGILDGKKALEYQKTNEQIVTNIVMKAYEDLGDGLLLLKGNAEKEQGLYYKPKGNEYYCYLLRESVGTDKSPDEIKSMLNENMKENIEALRSLVANLDDSMVQKYSDPLEKLSASEILTDLKERIVKDFPLLNTQDYRFNVNNVDESLEAYTAPAYYFTPPIDALYENNIYVNQTSTSKGLDLYTTLAHEGFPGHLYQAVTTQTFLQSQNTPPLRSVLGYGGFTEGYATYAEMYSYSYAKECALELTGNENVFAFYDILKFDRSMKLCLYSILDLMIHHEGKNVTQVADYLKNYGINDYEAAESIYEYIVNEPTNYLKYYVGYLEILECKKLAKDTWGSGYSDAKFHTLLMKIGPAPFEMIKKNL